MSWRKTSLYLCTASLYLEKVVASKELKFAMETDVERKARPEKMVAPHSSGSPGDGGREKSKKRNEFNLDLISFFFKE